MQSEYLTQVLQAHPGLLQSYLQGMTLISHPGIIMSILDTVEHFCEVDTRLQLSGTTSLLYEIEAAGGIDLLEELQRNPNQKIYQRVIKILETQIGVEEPDGE